MTLQEWRWALVEPDSGLSAVARHIALTLGLYMTRERPSCYPSVPTIATAAARSESTVKAATKELEQAGFLARRRGIGAGNATKYEATFRNVRIADVSSETKRPIRREKTSDSGPKKGRISDGKSSKTSKWGGPPASAAAAPRLIQDDCPLCCRSTRHVDDGRELRCLECASAQADELEKELRAHIAELQREAAA